MSTVLAFPVPAPVFASAAETAKLLKAALKVRFPATKFSVKLSRGTGYGNCSVRWVDGPTVKLVDDVCSPFEGEGFDGMTDSTIHYRATLADGRRSGLRMILTSRHVSLTLAKKAAHQVAAFYGLNVPEFVEHGEYWSVVNDSKFARDDIREYWSSLILQAASDASRFAR